MPEEGHQAEFWSRIEAGIGDEQAKKDEIRGFLRLLRVAPHVPA